MAGIIFIIWYFSMGIIFWKCRTNTCLDKITKILNTVGELKVFVWYFSMFIIIMFWPFIGLEMIWHNLIGLITRRIK